MMPVRIGRIEDQIERADRLWRLRRFAGATLWTLSALSGVLLLLGVAIVLGWLGTTTQAVLLMLVTFLALAMTWCIRALLVWGAPIERARQVAAIEAAREGLMDRLHTLQYLESTEPQSPLAVPIATQASHVLATTPPRRPYSLRPLWYPASTCLVLAIAAWGFYTRFEPWNRLRAAELAAREAAERARAEQEFVIPDDVNTDPSIARSAAAETWGEVRISQPGYDVRAAPYESLAIEIEAAASEPLQKVTWWTSVNGEVPRPHDLPPPEDPRFAHYQTELDFLAMGLDEWDVVAYYAEATSEQATRYASELYFAEIFPLREELVSLPGGEEGEAYRLLQQLTQWIEHQQEVVRQEFRAEHLPSNEQVERQKALERIAREQALLAGALQRAEAAWSVRWNDRPEPQPLLNQMRAAAEALEKAAAAPADATRDPRAAQQALGELAATRKALQSLLDDHPEVFEHTSSDAETRGEERGDPWQSPTSAEWAETEQAIRQLADRQLPSEPQASPDALDTAAWEADFARLEQRPGMNDVLSEETAAAREALQAARQADESDPTRARQAAHEALSDLRHAAAIETHRQHQRELQDLARQVEQQQDQLDAIRQAPEAFDEQAMRDQADRLRRLLDKLQNYSQQQMPKHERLAESLKPETKKQLDAACQKLGACRNAGEKRQAAADARERLQPVGDALQQALRQAQADEHHAVMDRMLDAMEAQRNAMRDARRMVQETLQAQRQIQRDATRPRSHQYEALRLRQEYLHEQFEQHRQAHQQALQCASGQCEKVGQAMGRAASLLAQGPPAGSKAAEEAANELQALDDELGREERRQELISTTQLENMARRHAEQLQQMENQPQSFDGRQGSEAGQVARRLAEQIEQVLRQPGVLPPGLQQQAQRLTEQARSDIDRQAKKLEQATEGSQRGAAARALRQALEKLLQAAQAGRESGLARRDAVGHPRGDPLRDEGHRALARALRALERLSNAETKTTPLTPEQQQHLRKDAAENLAEGVPAVYGHNQRTEQFVERMRRELVEEMAPIDRQVIQRLVSQIEGLRREVVAAPSANAPPPELQQVDPATIPAGYRGPVEKYFERLSEQP